MPKAERDIPQQPVSDAARPPACIELTEVELLKLENLQLKIKATEDAAKQLLAARNDLKRAIEHRLGIEDLGAYIMNVNTGKGRLAKGGSNAEHQSVG